MESSEYISIPSPSSISKNTQTDFPDLYYQEILNQKDRIIQQLLKELSTFRSNKSSFSVSNDKNLEVNYKTKSFSPYSFHQKAFSLDEPHSSSLSIKKQSPKALFDTMNIEEINSLTPETYDLSVISEYPTNSNKHQGKPHYKIPIPYLKSDLNPKPSLAKQAKVSLKSKSKDQKQSKNIANLLHKDDDYNKIINVFKNSDDDPEMLNQMLYVSKIKGRANIRGSVSTEPELRKKVNSTYRNWNIPYENSDILRPKSPGVNYPQRTYRPLSYIPKDIDWSKSPLEAYSYQSKTDLSVSDPLILSGRAVEDLIFNKNIDNFELIYEKAVKTLEKLKSELFLPASYMIIPPKSKSNLEKLLEYCSQLYKSKALIIKILQLIRQREDCLLKLMSNTPNTSQQYTILKTLSQEVLQKIYYLKATKFPINNFIYLNNDYSEKIHKDFENIYLIYPDLKSY
ncbi:hypothetical protein SteCoe_6616 [Stentor coeruleus]|uniref:Uncharacterized protein n=1 Tax=Stentor coeruleus TaxID=5963 RepID=A0A1R2CPL8_9CILI|nr:hypothetical protein SteCoe_6616 [Stentor coeruleus]